MNTRKLPLFLIGLMLVGGLLALPAKSVMASGSDMEVTMQVDIPLYLDVSDRTNPVFRGHGDIYMTTEDASSHQYLTVSIPDTLEMSAPDGSYTAPNGTEVTFNGSMNARKGYANFEAKNGLNGKTVSDISTGSIDVAIPITTDLLSHGKGNYSVSIPVTFTASEAYGSYNSNLDFTPWDTLLSEGSVKVSSGKITEITKQDEILEIDPSISALSENIFNNTPYKEVSIPSTVTQGANAFKGSSVETIILGDGMTTVPASLSKDAESLRKVVLPSTVTTFGNNAFDGCISLSDINLPGVMSLGKACFKNCKSLKEFTLNSGTTIATINNEGDSPFYGAGLEKVTVSEGVTNLSAYSFCSCESLRDVYLPTTLTTISSRCIYTAPSLKEITVRSDIARESKSTVVGAFTNTGLTKITFTDGVTSIPRYLFGDGCANVTEIDMPDTVTSINSGAFAGCSSLTELTLPQNLSYIDGDAFKNCTSLNTVTIPRDVTMSRGCVVSPFRGGNVQNIIFEEGVTSIPYSLFRDASANVSSISFPSTLTKIDSYAFSGCSSLSELNLPASVTTIGLDAFAGATSLSTLYINSSWAKASGAATSPFENSGIRDIYVADGITKLGAMYLSNNSQEEMLIHISTTVTNIDSNAFLSGATYSVIYDGTEAEYATITKGAGFTPVNVTCSDTLLNTSSMQVDDTENLINDFIEGGETQEEIEEPVEDPEEITEIDEEITDEEDTVEEETLDNQDITDDETSKINETEVINNEDNSVVTTDETETLTDNQEMGVNEDG